jgi:hypothetical protein
LATELPDISNLLLLSAGSASRPDISQPKLSPMKGLVWKPIFECHQPQNHLTAKQTSSSELFDDDVDLCRYSQNEGMR